MSELEVFRTYSCIYEPRSSKVGLYVYFISYTSIWN